jgi:tryptophan-rich sensory protein
MPMRSRLRRHTSLFVFLALVLAAASTGMTYLPGPFYVALAKPPWTAPDWVFAPAWAVLYVMIAVAGSIVWRAQGLGPALGLWLAQLALNAAWSWLMFGRKQIDVALLDMGALWLAILAFVVVAWPVRRSASALFAPYFLWVTYAAALNIEIWRLNS